MNDCWMKQWNKVLQGASTKLFFFDFDGTIWDDILVVLNEQFGPINEATGKKLWLEYDHAFKVAQTMTNGAHLSAEYADLLVHHTVDELISWLTVNHKLIPGVHEFMRQLKSMNVTPVGITNGAGVIASAMLAHHGIDMRFVSNELVFNESTASLQFFHNENDGIDKGLLVRQANVLGHQVMGFAGDSRGDIKGAQAANELGGLVLAYAGCGLADYCRDNFACDRWISYTDFQEVMQPLQASMMGCV